MYIHFWGVCGSLPSPQSPSQIKSKVSAILERLTPGDIESPGSRERFLSALPPWLFGTVGGNTPCISIHFDDSPEIIVLDGGSGMREMGIAMAKKRPKPGRYHVFYSHFHWDHIQGLPFFNPVYDPSVSVDFYSPMKNLESALHGQMTSPYFPVHMESMGAKKTFHVLDEPIMINGLKISFKKLNHPGDAYAYRFDDGKHRFVYASDTELSPADFLKTHENVDFFHNADIAVIDSQYTLGEVVEKYNRGHSAFSLAVDFAANWNIRHLILFHHDPACDDKKLLNNLQSARGYTERTGIKGMRISLAMEGMELTL